MRPVRALAKWLLVPAVLAVAGYYLVGPRIYVPKSIAPEVDRNLTMLKQEVKSIVHPGSAGASAPAPAVPQTGASTTAPTQLSSSPSTDGPQVEVTVRSKPRPHARRTSSSTRKHKTHPKAAPKPKPETTDEGSYGGTQDQSGTTTTGGGGNPP